ncbi:MAG TPA: hypothetical protein VNX15_01250, partial [Gemmatimonadales bacterium]|nr:hypothetical protein [Gemmatimonadales bacterium]
NGMRVRFSPRAFHKHRIQCGKTEGYSVAKDESGIQWLDRPEEQDYAAAKSYLSLTFPTTQTTRFIQQLRRSPVIEFKAKDIFRASGLSLLGVSNEHVEKDRRKIASGKKLSPLLLVRDRLHGRVIIADGYHRLCAVYGYNEDASIPCKIA